MDSMDSMDHLMNVGSIGSLSQWVGLSGAHVPISRGPDVGAQLRISFEDFLRAYEASLRTDRLRAVGDLESSAQIGSDRLRSHGTALSLLDLLEIWNCKGAPFATSLGCTIYPYRHLRGEGKVPGNVQLKCSWNISNFFWILLSSVSIPADSQILRKRNLGGKCWI